MAGRPSDLWLSPESLETSVGLGTGTAQIGSVTVANNITLGSNVTLNPSSSYIGLVTTYHGGGNVSLNPSSSYIGLVTTYHGGGNVSLNASDAWIGLVTVFMGDSRVTVSGADITNDVMKVEGQFSHSAITSLSTVAVKGSAGFLHLINVGAPSCPTTIIYDSATPDGTKIQTLSANYPMGSHLFDVKFTNGLSLDTVASGGDIVPQITTAWR